MKNNLFSDTIAAISTPPGKGGVALIRVSGEDAIEIAEKVFLPKSGRPLSSYPPRHAVYGDIGDGKRVWDNGIAVIYAAPSSYTGENTVEITCHGGALVQKKVLSCLFLAGARQAEAGEFTRRAMINGRLSLSEAEAVADILEAKTEASLMLAGSMPQKRFRNRVSEIAQGVTHALAALNAKIDFPDEDLADMTDRELIAMAKKAAADLSSALNGYSSVRAIKEGINCVIAGRPNVGKSSLYNALAGEDLAIVTSRAGTTRDMLTSTVSCGKALLRITDTAGLRESEDEIEAIGVSRAYKALDNAELILAVFDGAEALSEEDRALIERLSRTAGEVIAVVNKSDICEKNRPEIEAVARHTVYISAKNGDGIEELCRAVEELFVSGDIDLEKDLLVTSEREAANVSLAILSLTEGAELLSRGVPPDAACEEFRIALDALLALEDKSASEEIVDELFSHFCVGK